MRIALIFSISGAVVSSLRQSLSQATTANEITSSKVTNEKDSPALSFGRLFSMLISLIFVLAGK